MILGFDHIALSAGDLDAERASLEAQGFQCLFLEKEIPNSPLKAKLLEHYELFHEIGFFKAANGVPVELINHGKVVKNRKGPYERRGEKILLRTPDREKECDFWVKALRFRRMSDYSLKLTSPVPGWSLLLEVTEDHTVRKCTLDASGYTCLAFYSNDLIEDASTVEALGAADLAGPFDLVVNRKTLQILMFRTPGGAICELIRPRRTS